MNTDLNKFDNEERLIHSALSRIKVDSSELSAKVIGSLHTQKERSARRIKRGLTLVAAIVSIMAITTTALAATGGFDWIMQRINPSFAEAIEPVMLYTEDEGIRMTVIGAQTFDNRAVVYVSLQDVSGENRLTEYGSLGMGLFLKEVIEESISAEINTVDEFMPPMISTGTGVRRVYFDEATGTAYFELTMTATDGTIANSLIINNTCVELDRVSISSKPVGIALENLEAPNTLDVTLGYDVNSSLGWNDDSLFGSTISMLEPGRFAELPSYTDNHWVSNIGLIDGRLHVQTIGYSEGRFGGSGVSFALLRSDGATIHTYEMVFATADENYNLMSSPISFVSDRRVHHVTEFIFDVDVENLSDYILTFYGSISAGVEGEWTVQVDTSDTSTQIITISEAHYIAGHTIEFVTVTPIGINVRGSFPAHRTMDSHETLSANIISTYIETKDSSIELSSSARSYSLAFQDRYNPEPTGGSFTAIFDATSFIDLDSVTALVINGYRIEIS